MANKRRKEYEATDVGDMVRRMFRGLVRRAGDAELDAVEQLALLQRELAAAVAAAARAAHDDAGYSWSQIADALGTSRQGAQQRAAAAADQVPA